jgi:hypothetical protein
MLNTRVFLLAVAIIVARCQTFDESCIESPTSSGHYRCRTNMQTIRVSGIKSSVTSITFINVIKVVRADKADTEIIFPSLTRIQKVGYTTQFGPLKGIKFRCNFLRAACTLPVVVLGTIHETDYVCKPNQPSKPVANEPSKPVLKPVAEHKSPIKPVDHDGPVSATKPAVSATKPVRARPISSADASVDESRHHETQIESGMQSTFRMYYIHCMI